MMDVQLTLTTVLQRAVEHFDHKEIVTKLPDGGIHRYTYADAYERICRLAHVLDDAGLGSGDRVSVMAKNHFRHFELYFGPSCSGRSIHMTNHRLPDDHLIKILNEAEDRILFVDPEFVGTVERVEAELETVEQFVVLDESVPDTALDPVTDYEAFIDGYGTSYSWPELDEDQECGLCYTSGTTGMPKGASYTHRGIFLQCLIHGLRDSYAFSEEDVLLPVVPMYHVNGWMLPYGGTMYGSKQVLPGDHTGVEAVEELIRTEEVTLAGAVPTIWIDMAEYLDENPEASIETLDRVQTGGSSIPPAVMRKYDEEYDAPIMQGYGMTEASPHLVNTLMTTEVQELPKEEQYRLRNKPGIPVPGVQLRLRTEDGEEVPHDGESKGEIQVRAPWVIDEYPKRPEESERSFTSDGWFKTGDIGTIDEYGFLAVVDRIDDIIKSGGEWISSVELENELIAHDDVVEATVVSVEHEKWQERPVAYVVTETDLSAEDLREHLLETFPKWWLPDRFEFVDEIPRTTTGKFDKQTLRTEFKDRVGTLPTSETDT